MDLLELMMELSFNIVWLWKIWCYLGYICLKSNFTYTYSHYFAKIKVDTYDSLPIEKRLTLHNVILLIKTVLNKNKNNCYYKIFLEKCLYQLVKK